MAEFDKSKIFTCVNADEIKVGSIGYFSSDLKRLKNQVTNNEDNMFVVESIASESYSDRFIYDGDCSASLFYLIEEPKENKYRPFKDMTEFLETMCDGDIECLDSWFYNKDEKNYQKLTKVADDYLCFDCEIFDWKMVLERIETISGKVLGVKE